jgi:hypothetical protein
MKKPNQSEMIQRRPKTPSRKCKSNLHDSLFAAFALRQPAVASWFFLLAQIPLSFRFGLQRAKSAIGSFFARAPNAIQSRSLYL